MSLDLTDRKTLIASLPPGGVCAELGVDIGEFSQIILDVNYPRELWLVDCWSHQTEAVYGHDPANPASGIVDERYIYTVKRFFNNPKVRILREWTSNAATLFPPDYFDWVYIDANHLKVDADIAAWWPLVKPGGWMTGHDYTAAGDFILVKPMVDKWIAETGLELFVAGLESENVYERNYPSWAVQKPLRSKPCLP